METAFSGASNLAAGVDKAFIIILSISFILTFAIVVLIIYTLIRFSRKREKNPRQFTGNTKLEIVWTIIPLIIVLVMFYYGWKGFSPMRDVPVFLMKVTATGEMYTSLFVGRVIEKMVQQGQYVN